MTSTVAVEVAVAPRILLEADLVPEIEMTTVRTRLLVDGMEVATDSARVEAGDTYATGARVAELTAQRAEAERALGSRVTQIDEIEDQLSDIGTEMFITTQNFNFAKVYYDVARYTFEVEREEAHAENPAAEVSGQAGTIRSMCPSTISIVTGSPVS